MGLLTGWKRRRQRGQATGVLKDYLDTPAPPRNTAAAELALLAVDFETTGLDAASDDLLSIGFVAVNGIEIDLSTADRFVIRGTVEVGQSATVHGLTDDELAGGCELEEAITATLVALRGRVLLAHYTTIEESFLDRACARLFGSGVSVPAVDTMMMHRHLLEEKNQRIHADSVRLWAARDWFGLPEYRAHEALTDALACAELYLAQIAEFGTHTTLAQLRRWSG